MEIRWPFQAHHLLILTHFIRAQLEIIIRQDEKTVYAIPGSNVTLQCYILKQEGIHITQTQWTKVDDDPASRIAVYNPDYGFEYLHFAKMGYSHSANFSKQCHPYKPDLNQTSSYSEPTANDTECNQWSLQLNNVSLELTGQYECSFATYPAGTKSSKIKLIVKEHDEKRSVVEALLNQSLEIPCFKDMSSSVLANATLKWRMMKGAGNEEILITQQPYYHSGYRPNATIYKERIHVNPENKLRIAPVSILDDGKKFVCYLTNPPGLKSTTEVKVFAKPEISIVLHTRATGKPTLTCVVRKAFPKPFELLWYMDRKILKDKSEGIVFENEDIKDEECFYEMRSLLTRWDPYQLPVSQNFSCRAVYFSPGNELQHVSSEEIYLPFGFQTTSLTTTEVIRPITPVSNYPEERLQGSTTVASKASVNVTHHPVLTLPGQGHLSTKKETDLTSLTIPSSSPTVQGTFNLPAATRKDIPTKRVTELTSVTSPSSSSTRKDITDSVSTQTVTELYSLTGPGNSPTVKDRFNITGATKIPGPRHFSWPAYVAVLLLICSFLIVLGIRKWCHYQKEIMNRPPSFKPPPPPVKYTSMQDSDGTYPSCNELENL